MTGQSEVSGRSEVSGQQPGTGVGRRLVIILAVATGVSVANNYYAQPLLATIRTTFHASAGEAGLIVTAAQVGYAAGLVFVLPLGDILERRRLVFVMSILCAAGLIGEASSPVLPAMFAAAALVGATSVVAQILVAFIASLAGDAERGRVVGSVMSGLLLGILLARTVAGYVAQIWSWRAVYVVAAALMVILALTLWRELPVYRDANRLKYRAVLASVVSLFRTEPTLRRRCFYGFLSFAAFSVLWTSLAFLLSASPYRYGTGTIGLFGLAGAAGAGMASVAGRLADRGHHVKVTIATAFLILVAFVVLWVAPDVLAALIIGIVVLDLGCQGIHVTNQSEIFKLAPQARSRINAAYMACYFAGGTLGSVGSAMCFSEGRWPAVCGLGVALAAVAFLKSLGEPRYQRRLARSSAASPK
jgi:predicted MFS family arabinose efflux permease